MYDKQFLQTLKKRLQQNRTCVGDREITCTECPFNWSTDYGYVGCMGDTADDRISIINRLLGPQSVEDRIDEELNA